MRGPLDWQRVPDDAARALAARVLDRAIGPEVQVVVATVPLSFYESARLTRILVNKGGGVLGLSYVFAIASDTGAWLLDGTSVPVHDANEALKVRITAETAADYVRFFTFAVRSDQGPFQLVEASDFPAPAAAPAPRAGEAAAGADAAPRPSIVRAHARDLTLEPPDEEGRFRLKAVMAYDGALYGCTFAVTADGQVEMIDDSPLAADVPADELPRYPVLDPTRVLAALAPAAAPTAPPAPPVPRPPTLRSLVLLLLEQALLAQAGHRLVQRFNASTGQASTAVARFARHLLTAAPVVAVESTIPFVEEEIAEIVTGHAEGSGPRVERGQAEGGDDTRLKVGVPGGNAIVLISCHAYRGIVDVARVAHEIGSREVTALIGCERFADVPEPLRAITDLRLPLPGMTPALFETWFTQVMGGAPPADWTTGGTAWVTHVRSTDLQQPRHLELPPDEAFAYVRDTVQERLRVVDPERSLGLRDLHGLGEARRFAEDLIADIHAAIAGRLPWGEVDRGVLLVGPPGTGKTTLARAIAKDCGVKFISASAASWQASGHLGDHIRAIRADFAQARRHAPAILFLDEIDSVGNRERFTGQNAQYNTEVVNALLEQMQGLDPAAPVIVIAATNHADRVDPALRRAGRLDRVIEISRPGVDALTAIYQHYLAPHAAAGLLAPDVSAQLLAQLSLGLTGADVELMVRGAARRARKGGRQLGQADLIAEVTGLPRDGASSPRLTPDEVLRVSVHEAGHAIARCFSGTKGQDITFVSILPRPDGRLGFVAFVPPGGALMTRREYLEKLEVTLAGRAAEEIEFGEEGVTGGAGGEASSDLAVATRIALALVMQYGLGMEKTLMWSEAVPTPAQVAHAERVLANAYAGVVAKLRANQPRLRALAEALRQRQELTGAELRAVVGV